MLTVIGKRTTPRWVLTAGGLSALLLFVVLLVVTCGKRDRPRPAEIVAVDPLAPVRPLPEDFPAGTHMPEDRESKASGSVDLASFSPGRELTHIDDARVWWESDNDVNDVEDDHTIHVALELPLRRLIEMVCARGGILEVHDAYRPTGIHNPRSLHKEGRAVDVTCDEMALEELARLCWAAGFDWVYHEAARNGNGAHIHCSVRKSPDQASGGLGNPSMEASERSITSSGSE